MKWTGGSSADERNVINSADVVFIAAESPAAYQRARSALAAATHLTADKLRAYRFGFPPAEDQHAIVQFLDRETARIDAMIGKVNLSIDRLREYRTALISAAVTGKLIVRKVA
jgi:hypothetical protein